MKFGLFYELQLPRPWKEGDEQQLFQEALDQAELADKLSFDYLWAVEHHFLEEYSHCSAPEIFLAACSQRTKYIRLGHGVVLMPSNFNHPARVAERISSLDLLSNGRVEFGTGKSSSRLELEGFGVDFDKRHEQWEESVEQCANMMTLSPYPGFKGKYFSLPCRNVVPKPLQKPHPPLWVACSNRESIKTAARLGMGALTFTFPDFQVAKQWADDYYKTLKEECIPIGHSINPNICTVTDLFVHHDSEEARRRSEEGFKFFSYSLAHYYTKGNHKPGKTSVWNNFKNENLDCESSAGLGTPQQVIEHIKQFEEAGIDQVTFLQQAGKIKHQHICESMELFAQSVMPIFKKGEQKKHEKKMKSLAPYLEEAMARKKKLEEPSEEEIGAYDTYNEFFSEKRHS